MSIDIGDISQSALLGSVRIVAANEEIGTWNGRKAKRLRGRGGGGNTRVSSMFGCGGLFGCNNAGGDESETVFSFSLRVWRGGEIS